VTVLANGAPVSSRNGGASSSQRSRTTGPLPLASTPTTHVPPMTVSTVKPYSFGFSGLLLSLRFNLLTQTQAAERTGHPADPDYLPRRDAWCGW
jgi:hypothetical protein